MASAERARAAHLVLWNLHEQMSHESQFSLQTPAPRRGLAHQMHGCTIVHIVHFPEAVMWSVTERERQRQGDMGVGRQGESHRQTLESLL